MEHDHQQRAAAESASSEVRFPMRMNSIEKFHWFDDDPVYPNLIFCRMEFALPVDHDIAQHALDFVLNRHPFTNVVPVKTGNWQWHRRNGFANHGTGPTEIEYRILPGRPDQWHVRDHQANTPVAFYMGVDQWPVSDTPDPPGGCSQVWFHVHHAIGDGIACIQMINEWLIVYNNLRAGLPADHRLTTLNYQLIKDRNKLGLMSWRYLKHIYKQPIALFGAAKFVFRKTAQLFPANCNSPNAPQPNENSPASVSRWISTEQTKAISQSAAGHEITANSLLMAQWYQAIGRWRQRQTSSDTSLEWIRLILPMSVRSSSDRKLPVANRTSIVQIDRQSPTDSNLPHFYRMLDREIRIIRGWQLEKMFLIFIRLFSFSNWLLKRVASNPKSRGISVFTDLGRPFGKAEKHCGRLQNSQTSQPTSETDAASKGCPPTLPMDFELVGPVRQGTPLNLSISRYQRRCRISLRFDPTVVTKTQAQSLLDLYVDELESI